MQPVLGGRASGRLCGDGNLRPGHPHPFRRACASVDGPLRHGPGDAPPSVLASAPQRPCLPSSLSARAIHSHRQKTCPPNPHDLTPSTHEKSPCSPPHPGLAKVDAAHQLPNDEQVHPLQHLPLQGGGVRQVWDDLGGSQVRKGIQAGPQAQQPRLGLAGAG
ncbi:hypothetical protein F751_5049 [Auxenochlorella protothecoides]|uniref:Uncharacterized protein n=1 Tax=Auxenochlorella protothecoides TaxID=3075 RepID=A0A087SEQ3_AUXPR|nr:hypothetical protein F751_5049 [Auxenochlorella protothecoides]KFM24207.1 hypothetical protein F751_5049 [Auxenochlorella protothecoides]